MRIPYITEYPDEKVREEIKGGKISHTCFCCGCGFAHECIIEIKKGYILMSANRLDRSTAQMRRHGHVELLDGTDKRWKMTKR